MILFLKSPTGFGRTVVCHLCLAPFGVEYGWSLLVHPQGDLATPYCRQDQSPDNSVPGPLCPPWFLLVVLLASKLWVSPLAVISMFTDAVPCMGTTKQNRAWLSKTLRQRNSQGWVSTSFLSFLSKLL